MFHPHDTDAYRAIRAPQELKTQILSQASQTTSKPRYLTALVAVAACLVLLIGLTVVHFPVSVDIDVTALSPTALTATDTPSSRIQEPFLTTITLSADGKIVLESDAHGLYIQNEDEFTPLEHRAVSDNRMILLWYVEQGDITLTINKTVYTLRADPETATVTVIKNR